MNFYYDPVLGLQYNNIGFFILLDIESLPKNMPNQEILNFYRQKGVEFLENTPTTDCHAKITEHHL